MPSFLYDKELGKCLPRDEWEARNGELMRRPPKMHIQREIEAFKSPIDGKLIETRRQLKDHHREHGTTDARDYSPEHFAKAEAKRNAAIAGNNAEAVIERRGEVAAAVDTFIKKTKKGGKK